MVDVEVGVELQDEDAVKKDDAKKEREKRGKVSREKDGPNVRRLHHLLGAHEQDLEDRPETFVRRTARGPE